MPLTNPADRRQFGRRATSVHGTALVAGRPPAHCLVRDVSKGGALLEFQCDVWLPFRFRLTIDTLKIDTHCEIRHQRDNRVGVMFVGTQPGVVAVVEKLQARLLDADDWQGPSGPRTEARPLPAETLRTRVFRRLDPGRSTR